MRTKQAGAALAAIVVITIAAHGQTSTTTTTSKTTTDGNWMVQDRGHMLVLTNILVVPFAPLRPVGPGRFQGPGSNGQTITMWR